MSLTPELRKHFGAPEDRGVLVAHVEPNTPAAKAGVEVGDVIVELRGRKIEGASDVLSAVESLGKGEHVGITVMRDRASRSLDATLTSAAATPSALPWLRDWMKPFDSQHVFSTPFDEPWFQAWFKPLDPTKTYHSEMAPDWLRKLRDLVDPKRAAPTCQRS